MTAALAGRPLSMWSRHIFDTGNYKALGRAAAVYRHPTRAVLRYITAAGGYPWSAEVRTPLGRQAVQCASWNDLVTVNEIFCRLDYAGDRAPQYVLDVGANIGVAALWFLTRRPDAVVHSVEPDQRNLARLREQVASFGDRHSVEAVAASDRSGEVEFAIEPSGRYGGIGLEHAARIRVPARDINEILEERLASWPRIDLLKLDIEGHELTVLRRIAPELWPRIEAVAFEWPADPAGALPDALTTFEYERRADVHRLVSPLTA